MLRLHTLSDIMSRELVTLREEDSLAGLAHAMDSMKYRYLPVVDERRLVGLVTHRQLLRDTGQGPVLPLEGDVAQPNLQAQTFVGAVMNRSPRTGTMATLVSEAARWLLEDGVPCILVVDDEGMLLGIVTRDDVLRLAVALLNEVEAS